VKRTVALLLSLFLVLFVADAAISLLDDSIILAFGISGLSMLRALASLLVIGAGAALWLGMGLTPMIPKRYFAPLVLFIPVVLLGFVPLAIYFYARLPWIACIASATQLLLGLGIVAAARSGSLSGWPLVPEERLRNKVFSWLNTIGFLLVNVLVLLPATAGYLAGCASLAVRHFSDGFLALGMDGVSVRARTYSRLDGKTVQLIPMIHIGDARFYDRVSKLAETNAVCLLEGVTDTNQLLTTKLSYHRMAQSLGLAEQQEHFTVAATRSRRADLDISNFSPETVQCLNLVIRLHTRGLDAQTLGEWLRTSESPTLLNQVLGDLVERRNAHLVQEIRTELERSAKVLAPWGAAHMPGLAREITKLGFTLDRTEEYNVIAFGGRARGRDKL
jgi:hypothetical protein